MSWLVQPEGPAGRYASLPSQFGNRIRFLSYPLISAIVVLVGSLVRDEANSLVVLGFICLTFSVSAVWANSTPLVRLTFVALASHAAFGWIAAEPSAGV